MYGTSLATVAVWCFSAPRTSSWLSYALTIISQQFTTISFHSVKKEERIMRMMWISPNWIFKAATWKQICCCIGSIKVLTSQSLSCSEELLCSGCFSVRRPPQWPLPSEQPALAWIEPPLCRNVASAGPLLYRGSLCQSREHMNYWCTGLVCATVVGVVRRKDKQ